MNRKGFGGPNVGSLSKAIVDKFNVLPIALADEDPGGINSYVSHAFGKTKFSPHNELMTVPQSVLLEFFPHSTKGLRQKCVPLSKAKMSGNIEIS